MPISFELTRHAPDDTAVTVEGVTEGFEVPAELAAYAAATEFRGAAGQILWAPGRLLVGLGPAGANGDASRNGGDASAALRRAAIAAARAVRHETAVATTLPPTQEVAEGFVLGSYSFGRYQREPKVSKLETVAIVGTGGARARAVLERGARIGNAVAAARDLVNEPGGSLVPAAFADAIAELADRGGVSATVHDLPSIKRRGYAGVLAVNRGSTNEPRFVELTHEPEGRSRGTLALVGKGVTFDSGGLSLKTNAGMATMKSDMAGAAAVAAAVTAARDLNIKTRIRAFLPITDNMGGGDAQRVGDVITYADGTTVEVLNTDAEGRLILADALLAATAESPHAVVDLATLTGASMVALGKKVGAVFGNHDGFADQVRAAARAAGEPLWPLPLHRPYRRELDSKVADLKNVGSAHGGAITAALFLAEFVGEVPWAHLDIAGPSFTDSADDEQPAGGTGFGVRTLIELMTRFTRPKRSE